MADILVRGLSEETVQAIDTRARELGLSRNEFLRRNFTESYLAPSKKALTREDVERASRASADLLDDSVMAQAWQ